MRVTTAVTLATGAAVGFLFGIGVDEKTKERIGSYVKGKIFYALTGEEMPKKPPYKPMSNWHELKDKLFTFQSYEEAEKFLHEMIDIADNYVTVMLSDVFNSRGQHLGVPGYTWTRYGWQQEEVYTWSIKSVQGSTQYKVSVGPPSYLL